MKVEFWFVGKTKERWLQDSISTYAKRLRHYLPVELVEIPDVRNGGKLPPVQLKVQEGHILLSKMQPSDIVVLLDESGMQMTSREFAHWIERQFQHSGNRLVFVIGGAFGFSDAVYTRATHLLSLSRMTFSHQMVRLFLAEQVYRAMTILRNEPYHND